MARGAKDHPVDPARLFATGFPMGSVMTHHLGWELSLKIAAIASREGALWGRPCHPAMPVSVLEIHGTIDPAIQYPGMVRVQEGGTLGARSIATVRCRNHRAKCSTPAVLQVIGYRARVTVQACSEN